MAPPAHQLGRAIDVNQVGYGVRRLGINDIGGGGGAGAGTGGGGGGGALARQVLAQLPLNSRYRRPSGLKHSISEANCLRVNLFSLGDLSGGGAI
jgi:hypothetical protein